MTKLVATSPSEGRPVKPIMNLDEVEFDDVEANGRYTSKRERSAITSAPGSWATT